MGEHHQDRAASITRHLTLPVRIGVLLVIAAAVVITFLPDDIRRSTLLYLAAYVGSFMPALVIALAVWWLTWSRTWFVRALVALDVMTVILIAASGPIEEELYERRWSDFRWDHATKSTEAEATVFTSNMSSPRNGRDYYICFIDRFVDGKCYFKNGEQVYSYDAPPFRRPTPRKPWELPGLPPFARS